jgi:probable F420-dependent oxidoreductase
MQLVFIHPEPHSAEGEALPPEEVVALAVAAERAGFGAYAFTEHPAPPAQWLTTAGHQTLDPFVALGFVAAATTRIRLVTTLSIAAYRNPALLAKAAASVDLLSGGRLVLGLGAGYLEAEFAALGADFAERGRLLDEALEVLPLHWSGEPFSFEGRHFEARDTMARPRPVQQPIPMWIGGNSRASHRRVATKAQGWMPLVGPPELSAVVGTPVFGSLDELARSAAELRTAVVAAGRDPDAIDVIYPYADADIALPDADVERHRDAFGELEAIGVTWVALSAGGMEHKAALEAIERLGETYGT